MQTTGEARDAARAPIAPARSEVLRFLVVFGVSFGLLLWLLDGSGPIRAVNAAVIRFTLFQTRLAAALVGLLGGEVQAIGPNLVGTRFSCQVDNGCNGASAVVLLAAGVLSFPSSWRVKALAATLLPSVVLVNVLRLAGLYWVGSSFPEWFGTAHVYLGQVLVIASTVALWFIWLSWASRRPVRSS